MENYASKTSMALAFVVVFVYLEQAMSELVFTTFTKDVTCKLQDRLSLGSAQLKSGEHWGLVRCAAACMDQCSGVSVDGNNCYHHRDFTGSISCASGDVFFQLYYKNPCNHYGVWDPVRRICKCVGGWVGDRCERYPRDCKEFSTFGYDDAYYRPAFLQPENHPRPFRVHCSHYRDYPAFVTYILHNDGNYDNTMTWDDYVNGFYHGDHNYFAGVDNIKALTDAGHNYAQFSVVDFTGSTSFQSFNDFRIGQASTSYEMSATSNDGTPQYCPTPFTGVPFSTADRDNDQDSSNCARDGKAGWWFKTCDVGCNPLGPKHYWKANGYNLDSDAKYIYIVFQDT